MKKILIAATFAMTFASSSWAAENINVHDQVNNAQAPAHQMMSTDQKSTVNGSESTMMDMNQHEKATVAHESMNNSNSNAHQQMADEHKKMMGNMNQAGDTTAKPFSKMNEHEKAAIAHETMNNGQSGAHQQQAEKHRSMESSN
ncbi:TPA: copper-binding protein [Morganella morganii]|uniref:copper-binding protein n=1 Tax=Rahnella inusitata TaxID=58169 RepID=UPI0039BEC299|nr:copper-binding protein [Morganella morganii]HCR4054359.1 copper-binding protein [Morganella morganii]